MISRSASSSVTSCKLAAMVPRTSGSTLTFKLNALPICCATSAIDDPAGATSDEMRRSGASASAGPDDCSLGSGAGTDASAGDACAVDGCAAVVDVPCGTTTGGSVCTLTVAGVGAELGCAHAARAPANRTQRHAP